MAETTYYSALHYAKKAEKSAKEAAEAAASIIDVSGKIIQLGFDGSIDNNVLVFNHAPGGVDVPYALVDDYEYEIDLVYANTGSLSENVQMRIKNGSDTINFVSAVHRSSTEPATVGDMKAVMRFDSSTGYRWLFKAVFKITPAGAKVFLLYPVVYNDEDVKALQTADAQNVKLTGTQTITGYKTFTNPIAIDGTGDHILLKHINVIAGENPPFDCYNAINFADKNGQKLGALDNVNKTNGDSINRWELRYSIDGVQQQKGITNTKTASDNKTTLKFTTDYVNVQSTYFTNNLRVLNPNTSVTDAKTGQCYINFWTGDNKQTGFINSFLNADTTSTKIAAVGYDDSGVQKAWGLNVVRKLDGSQGYATLDSSPATTDNSTKIATTAFFRNNMQVVTSLPSSPTAGVYYFIKDDIPQEVANYDYVVDYKAPTSSDPSWYRVYKSGWVEQGGFDAEGTTDYAMHTINLLKPYVNTNYSLTGWYESNRTDSTSAPMGMLSFNSKTINSFKRLTSTDTYRVGLWWRAEGQGA